MGFMWYLIWQFSDWYVHVHETIKKYTNLDDNAEVVDLSEYDWKSPIFLAGKPKMVCHNG